MISRETIIEALRESLDTWPPARAAWLGGSDASGCTDPSSDIDLQLIVEDEVVDAAFGRTENALARLAPIAYTLRLPQPTWHGHDQAFFRLQDTDPCHMVDVVVMQRSTRLDRFLGVERHGHPLVLFDRDDLIITVPLDRASHRQRIERRLTDLRVRFELFQPLVDKAIARGHVAEAVHFYHAMSLRPLIDLLRIRHCPDRFDFGPRYLDRDVPESARTLIEQLSFMGDAAGLSANHALCMAVFRDTLAEIDRTSA